MQLPFFKYHGAGNDFIILHHPDIGQTLCQERIRLLCNRRFGIGADGLIVIENHQEYDFNMRYYNADGNEATLCGNGGRCAVAFAREAGYIGDETCFTAIDGLHYARFEEDGEVCLQMQDVKTIHYMGNDIFIDTGSPHLVRFVENVEKADVVGEGRRLRYNTHYGRDGANVNFVKVTGDYIRIRTYERGVENETLACGTGAVAATVAAHLRQAKYYYAYRIQAEGGLLYVTFRRTNENRFTRVFLKGPVQYVFSGIFQDINTIPNATRREPR